MNSMLYLSPPCSVMHVTCNACSAWMMTADLFSYEENKEKFRLPKKIKGFAEAIWEVEEDPDLVITLGKPPSKRRKRSTSKPGNKEEGSQVMMSDPCWVAAYLGLFVCRL